MQEYKITPGKVLYGTLYGAIIAGAYLFAKLFGHKGGLNLFTFSAFVIFIGHALLFPKTIFSGLLDWKMCVRGLLFGTTQVLIFKAQAFGHSSAALVSSTMGSVFGVLLGRLILGEKIAGIGLIAVLSSFGAVFLNPTLVLTSYWGIIGGIIQGTGFVLARLLMLEKKSTRASIATGFAMASIVGVAALAITGDLPTLFQIDIQNLLIVIGFALIIQYAFFYLYKILDSQRASILILSRIPWSFGLEYAFIDAVIVFEQLIASALILFSAILLIVDSHFGGSRKFTRIKN